MLDKIYRTHKQLLLVYLVCVSIILTLKFDKMLVLVLTILFLLMKFKNYISVFGVVLMWFMYYRFKHEGFTTGPPNTTKKPVNKIYYKFLDYFDLTKTKIEFTKIQNITALSDREKKYRDKWAHLFSNNNLIDKKYFVSRTTSKTKNQNKKNLDEMLYDTLGRLFKISNLSTTTSRSNPKPSLSMNVVYNDHEELGYKNIEKELKGTPFEYILKLVFLRNSMRENVISPNTTLSFKHPNIIDSKITDRAQINTLVKEAEYKTIDELNREAERIQVDENDIKHVELLSNLAQKFSSNMINIIEDILYLVDKPLQFSSVYDSYIYYIKQIFYIITGSGRLFYVGLFFMVISICLFFIETTK